MDRRRFLVAALSAMPIAGCRSVEKAVRPSNFRNWSSDQIVVPTAEFDGERVTVRNVRNCSHLGDDSYVVDHYDKSFSLADVKSVDFLVCPFADTPAIAHTMLSFGISVDDDEDRDGDEESEDGGAGGRDYLVASVEIRKEEGEEYSAWKGSARQYELMYVLADEEDAIDVRVNHRGEDVYLYRSTATPAQARDLLVDVLRRANKLSTEPEFYDTLTNNCTLNIVRHINRLSPDRVAYDYRVLLPGHSDRLAFDLGLIERHGSFDETKARAHINDLAQRHHGQGAFSELIRARL
jgi:hypothetical protein